MGGGEEIPAALLFIKSFFQKRSLAILTFEFRDAMISQFSKSRQKV
jgi:hypothetical protein